MAKIGRTLGAGLSGRRLLEGVARRPEFRTSILLYIVWLLALQVYQPWRLFRTYRPSSVFERAVFFVWRVGFNISESGPVAVTVGLALIVLLVYTLGWVVRSFTLVPSSSVTGRCTSKLDVTDAPNRLEGFMNLCHSIRLNCWQQIQANSSREANAQVLRAAYNDYKGQVSPWLSIIIDTSRSESQIVKQARNRAAECLRSLAGGFICVADFDSAQTLTVEALQLVFDNGKLEAEIKSQLDLIASEMSKFGPHPAASADAPRAPHARSRESEPGSRSLFCAVGNCRIRLSVIVAIGIALLLAIPFTIQLVTGPEWYPSLTGGGIGAIVDARTPRDPAARQPPKTKSFPPFEARATEEILAHTPPGWTIEQPGSKSIPDSGMAALPEGFTLIEEPPGPKRQTSEMPYQPVSLPNGTDLISPKNVGGQCELKISNYTDQDAAVKLKMSVGRTTVRFVYVQRMSDAPVPRILPGEYVLQFATGRDWDVTNLAFRQDRTFAAFDKVLSFSEKRVDDGTVYSTHEVTLHAVPNGNMRKETISADEFFDDLGVYH